MLVDGCWVSSGSAKTILSSIVKFGCCTECLPTAEIMCGAARAVSQEKTAPCMTFALLLDQCYLFNI